MSSIFFFSFSKGEDSGDPPGFHNCGRRILTKQINTVWGGGGEGEGGGLEVCVPALCNLL